MLSQMLFSCTYGEKCVKRSWNFLYLNFQATCNVLAQWVKCRWLVVAHFLPQGNFQMLTGMTMYMMIISKQNGPLGMAYTWRGCFRRSPNRAKFPLVEDPGYNWSSDLGQSSWSGGWRVRLWTDRLVVQICLVPEHVDLPPVVHK